MSQIVETGHLQTIVAVAQSGSFSKAAEDLHVTQSAISQSIKSLETKINAKLFKRSGRKVVLTPEGENLFLFARDFLERMEETVSKIQENKNTMSGKIRIGTLSGLGKSIVAPKIVDFASKYPELKIEIRMSGAKDLKNEFEINQLDCLILPEGDVPGHSERVLIGTESINLVYPKSDDFPISEKTNLEVLAQYPVLMFEDGDPLFYTWCRKRYGKTPIRSFKRIVVNSHGNILYAVSKGLGIAVVPTHVLRRSYYKDKISSLGVDHEVSNGKIYLVYQEEAKELLRMQKLQEEFLQEMKAPSV